MKYFVIEEFGRNLENEEIIASFDTLEEAIKEAQDRYNCQCEADKKSISIEVRKYEEDIEDDNCDNFDYDAIEWQVVIPDLSDGDINAIKELYKHLPYSVTGAADDWENDYLSINTGRDGREIVSYMDSSEFAAVYVDNLASIDEEEFEQQVC